MAVFVISYDLNKKKDYPKLYAAIKALGTWAHPVDSTWLVVSQSSATLIRDYLLKHVDNDDQLLITKLAAPAEAAWSNMNKEVTDWLQLNLK